jgi:hypothetical protein
MRKPTALAELLTKLTRRARAAGLSDTAWATRAGMRKETLSRLRGRSTCDLASVLALAEAVGSRVDVVDTRMPESTPDGHFVTHVSRDYEEQLVALCASGVLDPARWESSGPRFFMAGLAVMMANARGADRRAFLALAEQLHPGASEPEVFQRWLAATPLRPSRFLPLVSVRTQHAA